jgi:hypothetical protein
VRDAAANVSGSLRDRDLRPHGPLLEALIASPAFTDALVQLIFTLEHATERVDELVLLTARRFLDLYSGQLDTFATAVPAHAGDIGDLVLRAHAQAQDAESRRRTLDLVDDLLEQAAYGFSTAVQGAER